MTLGPAGVIAAYYTFAATGIPLTELAPEATRRLPRYPTVPMRLAAADTRVTVWSNQELQLDVNRIGLKGSPTWVSKIFSPERVKGEIIGDGLGDPVGTARLLVEQLMAKDMLAV